MISAEAPVLFSKACELFILDLTLRAWSYAELNDRKTLCRNDIADAIQSSDMFDFLQGVRFFWLRWVIVPIIRT